MQIKRHIFFIFSPLVFFLACKDKTSTEHITQSCFCDSIYKNRQTDKLQEFICYKGKHVYKLQLKDDYERISRHRLDDNRWLYEVFEKNLTDTSNATYNRYLTIKRNEKNYAIKYVGENVDSMQVIIFNDKDTLYSKFYKSNSASISGDLCDDTKNKISIQFYTTKLMKHPESPKEVSVTSISFIGFIKTSYLVKYPLDTVLAEMKRCIAQKQ